jgi:hypothetical protein
MTRTTMLVPFGAAAVLAVSSATAREGQAPASLVPPSAAVTLPADVTSLTAINRSSSVVAGLADGQVAVWNGRDAAPTMLKPHAAPVLAVGTTADGGEVWSVATDGSLARTRIAAGARAASRQVDLGPASTPRSRLMDRFS